MMVAHRNGVKCIKKSSMEETYVRGMHSLLYSSYQSLSQILQLKSSRHPLGMIIY